MPALGTTGARMPPPARMKPCQDIQFPSCRVHNRAKVLASCVTARSSRTRRTSAACLAQRKMPPQCKICPIHRIYPPALPTHNPPNTPRNYIERDSKIKAACEIQVPEIHLRVRCNDVNRRHGQQPTKNFPMMGN